MKTPARGVLMGAALVFGLALAHVLAHTRTQLAWTDRVPNNVFVTVLERGEQLCQSHEILPAHTADLRMTIGTYGPPGRGNPGPPLSIYIRAGEHHLASTIRAGWHQGRVLLAIPPPSRTWGDATVCIRNRGNQIALAGTTYPNSYGFDDSLGGVSLTSEVRIDYMLAGKPSWFSMIGALTYRLTLGKGSYIRPLGWLAPLLLMVAAAALALRLILREEREP